MDDFSYLSVLISIVLGLGVTSLLTGLARVVQLRDRIKIYWPTLAWVTTLLLIHVQMWWSMFGLRTVVVWTFPLYAITLLQPILLFFLSALIWPDFDRDEALDLKANYYAQVRWFFGILVALVLVSLVRYFTFKGHFAERGDFAFHMIFIVAATGGAVFRSELYHKIIAPLSVAIYVVYIAVLFMDLR
ncbi:MAG: hypothetical protein GC190_03085 [Alphaproteobacteria bacterium]|nr:hypothetical protein [Alphaproteobacteria bacterium]